MRAAADKGQVVAAEEHLHVAEASIREVPSLLLLERVAVVHSEPILHPTRKATYNHRPTIQQRKGLNKNKIKNFNAFPTAIITIFHSCRLMSHICGAWTSQKACRHTFAKLGIIT